MYFASRILVIVVFEFRNDLLNINLKETIVEIFLKKLTHSIRYA